MDASIAKIGLAIGLCSPVWVGRSLGALYDISEAGDRSLTALISANMRVSGTGTPINYDANTDRPYHDRRKEIIHLTIDDGVTNIPKYLCNWCNNLTTIELPDSLTAIPHACFTSCYCLQDVNIPSGVTKIGNSAFAYSIIERLRFSEGLTSFGMYAFKYATLKGYIELPSTLTMLSYNNFAKLRGNDDVHIFIPASVVNMAYRPFLGSSNVHVYCEIASDSVPDAWGSDWNWTSSAGNTVETTWGVTREEFQLLAANN